MTITFGIFQDKEGWLVARWDAQSTSGGITTQAHNLPELCSAIREAVECHFDSDETPTEVRLHFAGDPKLELLKAA